MFIELLNGANTVSMLPRAARPDLHVTRQDT